MKKFCPNCGTQVKPDAEFCPNCGQKLKKASVSVNKGGDFQSKAVQSQSTYNVVQQTSPQKPMSKKKKILFSVLGVLVVLLIALGVYGNHYYNSAHQINRIIDTIRKGDNDKLATLVMTEDSRVKINSNSVKSITDYYKNNQTQLTMLRNTLLSGGNIKWISLTQDGRYFLFFPKYKLDVSSYSPTIETNHAGSKIYIDNHYIKTAKSNGTDYSAKVGPMLGGKYNIKIKASASGHDLSTSASLDLWDENKVYNCSIKTADLAIIGPADGQVYIGDKNCGKLSSAGIMNLNDYQYNDETSVYIKYTSKGKIYTSNKANISKAVSDESDDDDDSDDTDSLIEQAQDKTNNFDSKWTNVIPEFSGAPSIDRVSDLIKNCFKDTDSDAFVNGEDNKYYVSFKKMSDAFDDSDKINDWNVTPDIYNVYPISDGVYECDAKVDYEFDHENDMHIQVAHYPHMTFKKDGGEFKILSVGNGKIIYDRTKKD